MDVMDKANKRAMRKRENEMLSGLASINLLPDEIELSCIDCDATKTIPVEEYQRMIYQVPGLAKERAYECEACRERRETKERDERRATQHRPSVWEHSLTQAGVPSRHRPPVDLDPAVDLPGFPDLLAQKDPWCVTLLGEPGCGKTWLGTWLFGHLMIEFCLENHGAFASDYGLWIDAASLAASSRRDIRAEHRENLVDRAMKKPILMLDDLAAERRTDWVDEQLYLILNTRHGEYLPTILTSNLGKVSELSSDARLVGRLTEGWSVKMPNVNYRRRG